MVLSELLVHFVTEREKIREFKERGAPAPWTADPILQRYRFCNMRRRDDRVSQWIIYNLIEVKREQTLWFTLLIARLINWPPTLAELVSADVLPAKRAHFREDRFQYVLEYRQARKEKVYTGAYMVYPPRSRTKPGYSKARLLCESTLADARAMGEDLDKLSRGHSVRRFTNQLARCHGLNTFTAGQVAADLTYAKGYLDDPDDLNLWAPLGPGSQRGLNYLFGEEKRDKAWTETAFQGALAEVRGLLRTECANLESTLTQHDIQNIMCEFGKYMKALRGHGSPRTLYSPTTEF